MKVKAPKPFDDNPRIITQKQAEQLKAWLLELGDLSGIVLDLNSNQFISGNQRARVLDLAKLQPVVTQSFDPPNDQGTVAVGFYEVAGELFSYRAVRWDKQKCRRAVIIANKAGGDWDYDILGSSWSSDELLELGWQEWELLDMGIIPIEPFFDNEEEEKEATVFNAFKVIVNDVEIYNEVLLAVVELMHQHSEWDVEIIE